MACTTSTKDRSSFAAIVAGDLLEAPSVAGRIRLSVALLRETVDLVATAVPLLLLSTAPVAAAVDLDTAGLTAAFFWVR